MSLFDQPKPKPAAPQNEKKTTQILLAVIAACLLVLVFVAARYIVVPAEKTKAVVEEAASAAKAKRAVDMLRIMASAEVAFMARNEGKYGTVNELMAQGYLDKIPDEGYIYICVPKEATFRIDAKPTEEGLPAIYITEDNVVRDLKGKPLNTN